MSDATLASPDRPKRPLWRRVLKWTVRIVAGLVVVLVVTWSVTSYLASRALSEQVEKIRAAGQPLTFADLARLATRPAEDQDAAPYYAAAALLQKGHKELDDAFIRLDRQDPPALSPDLAASIQDLLARNTLSLDLLDRGSALGGCNFDTGLEYGIGPVIPRLSKGRSLAKLASLRTDLLALTGEPDKAAASTVAALRMTRMFDAQPIIITYLVKVACLSLIAGDVPAILHASPDKASLDNLQQALLEAERTTDLKRMWVAERVYGLEVMRHLWADRRPLESDAGNRPFIPEAETWPGSLMGGLFIRWMAASALQRYGEYVEGVGKDWAETLAATEAISSRPQGSWLSGDQLAAVLGPSFSRSVLLSARMAALLRSARTAVLIDVYRLDTGHLPETLDEVQAALHIQVPADPFTGKDLVYRQTADGYLIYSLGESRRDQGGPATQPAEQDNWGYRIRLAAPAPSTATHEGVSHR